MSNTTIRFTKGPTEFFADKSEKFGRKLIKIRYILDQSQKDPIEGCYYEFEITHEIQQSTRNSMKICCVKLTNREQNEARHQVNMELAAFEKKRERQLSDMVDQIIEEIDSQWVDEYENIHKAVHRFFCIGSPHNIRRSYHPSRMILYFYYWKKDFKKVMNWESEFPNIIKFMEEKSENSKRIYKDSSDRLSLIINQIAEIDEVITNYPKKRIFIKTIDAEVDVFYDQDERKLAFIEEVCGKHTHYFGESDDGHRPAENCETNGLHSHKFFINKIEATSIIPLFKDLIYLIETKKELEYRLNREREVLDLKCKVEDYAIAERLLPQELLTQAVIHIY